MIVRRVYFKNQGMTDEQMRRYIDNREIDKLIDSLLPDTVERLRAAGVQSGFVEKKKFFLPSRIVGMNGKPIMREDG